MKQVCNSRLKDVAYQSDFDEDDFFNFTYVFKETESLVLHSDINFIITFSFLNVLLVNDW